MLPRDVGWRNVCDRSPRQAPIHPRLVKPKMPRMARPVNTADPAAQLPMQHQPKLRERVRTIRTMRELLSHADVKHDHDLHPCDEQERARRLAPLEAP